MQESTLTWKVCFQVSGVGCMRRSRTISLCAVNRSGGSGENGFGEGRTVRFRKDGADAARTSFGTRGDGTSASKGLQTPNERLLADVQATMEQLGVSTADSTVAPPLRKPKDFGHVNPGAAFAGAAGAALISGTLWIVLNKLVELYMKHAFTTDLYVVQRLTAIARVAIVGLLALASGISGVTALGLLLLAGRVTIDAISGKQSSGNAK